MSQRDQSDRGVGVDFVYCLLVHNGVPPSVLEEYSRQSIPRVRINGEKKGQYTLADFVHCGEIKFDDARPADVRAFCDLDFAFAAKKITDVALTFCDKVPSTLQFSFADEVRAV